MSLLKLSFEEKLENFITCAEHMPGVVVIHHLKRNGEFNTVYMSSRGLEQLGISLNELQSMGSKYHEKFFNNEDMQDFTIKLKKLLQNKDPNETFTFFQQVKLKHRKDWVWHIGSLKIFHQDEHANPTHLVTTVFPVDQMKHIPNKAERLLAENEFFKCNLNKFNRLGDRAKEVLKLVAMGKSSAEISEELCISVETVNTHRKNIKKKLGISTTYDFTEYAHAFDLI